jgi:hypothetical protein
LSLKKEYAELSLEIAMKCFIYNTECREFLSKIISNFLLYWSEFHSELALSINGPYRYSQTWQFHNAENVKSLEKFKSDLKPNIDSLRNVRYSYLTIDYTIVASGRRILDILLIRIKQCQKMWLFI